MRIALLTSNLKGTAAYCLPELIKHTEAKYVIVIYSEGRKKSGTSFFRKKLAKLGKIGLLGAINGVRIRKWFVVESVDGKEIENIESVCENNIRFFNVPAINSPETIDLLTEAQPDLALSLGNGYISSKVFTIPRFGTLNLHGEVLPDFQNAQSVIWQLFEGNRESGYTIHEVEKKIDGGAILKQEKFPILFRETLRATINATCTEILKRAAAGLADTINHFENYYRDKKIQGKGRSYTTPSLAQFRKINQNFRRLSETERTAKQ